MILDNVLLSDNIKRGEIVLTKGDLTINNTGFPEGLTVGKVIAIDKNPSALFQTAGIKNLIDFLPPPLRPLPESSSGQAL